MIRHGDIVELNQKELHEIVDLECKKRLGMTRREFLQRRDKGTLPQSQATQEIGMLLKLDGKK
jgi:hypothetical protein